MVVWAVMVAVMVVRGNHSIRCGNDVADDNITKCQMYFLFSSFRYPLQ